MTDHENPPPNPGSPEALAWLRAIRAEELSCLKLAAWNAIRFEENPPKNPACKA